MARDWSEEEFNRPSFTVDVPAETINTIKDMVKSLPYVEFKSGGRGRLDMLEDAVTVYENRMIVIRHLLDQI